MKLIEEKCLELHYKYGLGVCVTSEVHDLFHDIFGKGNNTYEQWSNFKVIFNKYNKNIQLIKSNINDVQATLEAMNKEQIKREKRDESMAEKKGKKKSSSKVSKKK